jgi:hypothetical protein
VTDEPTTHIREYLIRPEPPSCSYIFWPKYVPSAPDVLNTPVWGQCHHKMFESHRGPGEDGRLWTGLAWKSPMGGGMRGGSVCGQSQSARDLKW